MGIQATGRLFADRYPTDTFAFRNVRFVTQNDRKPPDLAYRLFHYLSSSRGLVKYCCMPAAEVLGLCARSRGGGAGMFFGRSRLEMSGPVHRLVGHGQAQEPSSVSVQQSLSHPALGARAASCIARTGAYGSSVIGGLASTLRTPRSFSRDVCRSRATSRDLLLGCELDHLRRDFRARTSLPNHAAQPIGEAGAWVSAGEEVPRAVDQYI